MQGLEFIVLIVLFVFITPSHGQGRSETQCEKNRRKPNMAGVLMDIVCNRNGDYMPRQCLTGRPELCACYIETKRITRPSAKNRDCDCIRNAYKDLEEQEEILVYPHYESRLDELCPPKRLTGTTGIETTQRPGRRETPCRKHKKQPNQTGIWVAVKCDRKGNYFPRQCIVGRPDYCACYSKTKFRTWVSGANKDCSCIIAIILAQEKNERTKPAGWEPEYHDYDDPKDKTCETTHNSTTTPLDYDDTTTRPSKPRTPCQRHQRTPNKTGVFMDIRCDTNGDYEPQQCVSGRPDLCSCYLKTMRLYKPAANMSCKCRVDRFVAENTTGVEACDVPRCQRNGTFTPKYCCWRRQRPCQTTPCIAVKECSCVDSDGVRRIGNSSLLCNPETDKPTWPLVPVDNVDTYEYMEAYDDA